MADRPRKNRGAPTRPPFITPQQQRAVDLFEQNIVAGGTKTIEEILVEAGYSEQSARQQTNVMAGIKPHLQPTLEWMEQHRQAVQEKMTNLIGTATYDELRKALDSLTHNIQLLGGKPTQHIAIAAEVRHKIDLLIED
jgi:hypothetical protein